MKIKSVIALMLAFVMVFCALPVFAAEIGDTVTWYNFGEYEVVYKGELQEGKTTFGTEVKPFYCTFDAKNEGYYLILISASKIEPQVPAEIKDGNFYDVDERRGWLGKSDNPERRNEWFCYFEKGENVIGFEFYSDSSEDDLETEFDVTVTYCGKVTDMTFAENAFDIISGTSDYFGWDPYNDIYDADEGVYTYGVDIKDVCVSFSSGKTVEMGERAYKIITDESLNEVGKHNAKIHFLGYEEDVVINAHPVSDYIKSVDIENAEKYAVVTEYYDGGIEWDYNCLDYETATVTYADGSEEKIILNEFGNGSITLSNGRTYTVLSTIEVDKEENGKSVYFIFCLSHNTDLVLNSYKCKIIKADIDENLDRFVEVTVGDYVGALVYYLRLAVNADSVTECVNSLSAFWAVFKECVKNRSDTVFEELVRLIVSFV